MKRIIMYISLILVMVTSPLVACAKPAPAPPEVVEIRLAGCPTVWSCYPYALSAADILNRNTNLEIIVEATAGSAAIQDAVAGQVMEIGGPLGLGSIVSQYLGIRDYEGQPNKEIRGIIALGMLDLNYIASPASGMKTLEDIKGKKVPLYTATDYPIYNEILKTYGLEPGVDFEEIPMAGDAEAVDELIMGRIDAMGLQGAADAVPTQEALGHIVFLPIPKERVLQAKAANPDAGVGLVPSILMPEHVPAIKLPGPIPGLAAPRLVLTHKALPDEVAYTIVTTMLENIEEYQGAVAPEFNRENSAHVPEIPWHPGAVKAFRELGLWTDEMEAAQQALLASE